MRMRLLAVCAFAIVLGCPLQSFAICGDGVVEQNEECDPGGALHFDGNPNLASCVNNSNCFFDYSCCKFNCQFVGQGASCFDGNACTTNDVCNNVGLCASGGNAAAGTPCDDGLFCTTDDTCNASGSCVSGSGSPCTQVQCLTRCNETTDSCEAAVGAPCTDDGDVCTNDVCDAQGACAHPLNTAFCDDGIFCNGADTCSGGTCSSHAGDPCVNGGQCANVCDEAGDTCNLPDHTPCDDGLFCTSEDVCVSGVCAGSGDPCAGGPECSSNCNEATDDCSDGLGSPCVDDGNPCTDDYCDGAGGCIHVANTAPCDDGLTCTTDDVCTSGVCIGAPPPACDDGNPCTFDTCEESSGNCLNLEQPSPTCSPGGVAQLIIANRDDVVGRDKLKWRWSRPLDGRALLLEDVGDPLTTTTYDLCLYDTTCPEPCSDPEAMSASSLTAHLSVAPGAGWLDRSSKGRFLYKDPKGLQDGITVVKVKLGTSPGLGVKAARTNLTFEAANESVFFHMQPRVAIQLVNSEGRCWGNTFETFVRNTPRSFRTHLTKVLVE